MFKFIKKIFDYLFEEDDGSISILKVIFKYIGIGVKKFFTLFNTVNKVLLFCFSCLTVGLLMKYNLPLGAILTVVLNIATMIKLAFDIKK